MNCYYEKHHILPRCMGGSNHKSNLVKLTYREHFLCHWLLTKFVKGQNKSKMFYALRQMTIVKGKRIINSWQYDLAKKRFDDANRIGNNNKCRPRPAHVAKAIGDAHRGKPKTKESIAKRVAKMIGRKYEGQQLANMRAAGARRRGRNNPTAGPKISSYQKSSEKAIAHLASVNAQVSSRKRGSNGKFLPKHHGSLNVHV